MRNGFWSVATRCDERAGGTHTATSKSISVSCVPNESSPEKLDPKYVMAQGDWLPNLSADEVDRWRKVTP
jgi:hypothetical protein